MDPVDARARFLPMLNDYVQLCYLHRALPDSFEQRQLVLLRSLGVLGLNFLDWVSSHATKFALYHELAHIHLKHFSKSEAERLPDTDSGRISAFEQELEFEADQFANQHLRGSGDNWGEAVAAMVGPPTFLYLLALKEAVAPTPAPASGAIFRKHPPSQQRAARLKSGSSPTVSWRPITAMLRVPEFLLSILESAAFEANAAGRLDR
jgi:hypothetical protein